MSGLEKKLDSLLDKLPRKITDDSPGGSSVSWADVVNTSQKSKAEDSGDGKKQLLPNSRYSVSQEDDRKFNVVRKNVAQVCQGPRDKPRTYEMCSRSFLLWMSQLAIRDLLRLGKFSKIKPKPRPILIKFIRGVDVTSVLSRVNQVKAPKSDRSIKEREKEKCLMSIRWSLIQSGMVIKLRGSSILVNGNLLGKVDSS